MFKFTKSFTAAALAMTAIAVSAQETSNSRADMFGQEQSTTAEQAPFPSPAQGRKLSITNATAAQARQSYEQQSGRIQFGQGAGQPNARGREKADVRQLQKQAGDQPAPLSEFQKFIDDNTGKVLPIFGAEFFANAPATFAPIRIPRCRAIIRWGRATN